MSVCDVTSLIHSSNVSTIALCWSHTEEKHPLALTNVTGTVLCSEASDLTKRLLTRGVVVVERVVVVVMVVCVCVCVW